MGIFYPVSGSYFDRDAIANLMELAGNVSEEFMLLTSSDRLDPTVSRSLFDSDLADLVGQASSLILGAYDGEGYVRWSRRYTM
jgi:hypothetical protein